MTQDKTGGYCPKCDTVWAAPGKCKCVDAEPKQFKEIWNAAIEAAAQSIDNSSYWLDGNEIRKLKK